MTDQWQPADTRTRTRRHVATYLRTGTRMVMVLDACVTDIVRLFPALEDGRDGISSSYGGGGTSGGDVSDPTFNRVNALIDGHADRAETDLAEVGAIWQRLMVDVAALDRIRQRHLHEPTPVPRQCRDGACPDLNPPRSNSGGRCDACRKFYDRHDRERETSRRQEAA